MEDLKWPEVPTCHTVSSVFKISEFAWCEPRKDDGGPYAYPFRTCSYCGSMHPEDLLHALEAGAQLGMADWKYGWPHKFYVDKIPNPKAGDDCEIGSRYEGGVEEPIMGKAPAHTPGKWYNEHLAELEPAAFEKLSALIATRTGIEFMMVEGKLAYRRLR